MELFPSQQHEVYFLFQKMSKVYYVNIIYFPDMQFSNKFLI